MRRLERMGEFDKQRSRQRRPQQGEAAVLPLAASTFVARALTDINNAVIGAMFRIVRAGLLGRLMDWATGSQVGHKTIQFVLHPRAMKDPPPERHAMPIAHACLCIIDISDYRTWRELYNHLCAVLGQSRFLFGQI